MNTVKIGSREVGEGKAVFIVAEAGDNHNGKLAMALRMVEVAKKAGADAVKFQTFVTEELVTRTAEKAPYQKENAPGSAVRRTQFEMLKELELKEKDFEEIERECRTQGIMFLSSPFDEPSVEVLERLGVPAYKVPSGEITNFPLLEKIVAKGKPVILSTGMSTMDEVREAVSAMRRMRKAGAEELVLLHCTSNYPAAFETLNLRAMVAMREEFGVPVGYSDHSLGIEASVAAVAMGACVIEKHFTLDKSLPGPDHAASLEPGELSRLVEAIRNVEKAMGDGVKRPDESEIPVREVARKSVVGKVPFKKGDRYERKQLTVKRPGTGRPPKDIFVMPGTTAEVDSGADMPIPRGPDLLPMPEEKE